MYFQMVSSKNNYSKLTLSVSPDENIDNSCTAYLKRLASTGFSSSCLYVYCFFFQQGIRKNAVDLHLAEGDVEKSPN